ncbi:NAD(P)-binding protein [Streptomyces sp. NPDC007883]|uniref:NAD(P)-binding protein n=1 Tax=Streptomyces sp. NPDC007883 TaxID=3155116 RepID=UPI00340BCD8F
MVAVTGGGQSGLAAACALRERGLNPVVLEVSEKPAGSWSHCRLALSPRRGAALGPESPSAVMPSVTRTVSR